MDAPKYVITLVHGTFARNATWLRTDSPLRQTLEAGLGTVLFQPFLWTGRNNLSARSAAAHELSRQLREALAAFPRASHVVIGHSHGGNIALYALRDHFVRRRISGVICLSTPFLHVRRRVPDPSSSLLFACVLALSTVAMLPWAFTGDIPSGIVAGIGILAAGVSMLSFVARHDRRVYKSLWLPRLSDVPMLIVRTIGDEASAFLATTQFVTWAMMRVWTNLLALAASLEQFIQKVTPHGWRRLWTLGAGLSLVSLIVPLREFYLVENKSWLLFVALLVVLSLAMLLITLAMGDTSQLFVMAATLALGTLALPLVILIMCVAVLPFGLAIALSLARLDITVDSTPAGRWHVENFDATRGKRVATLMRLRPHLRRSGVARIRSGRFARVLDFFRYDSPELIGMEPVQTLQELLPIRSLSHSQVYENADALASMVAWVKELPRRTTRPQRHAEPAD